MTQNSMKETAKTPEVYFHVGMPKTASTFLQRNVFPKLQNIHFVKKHDFKHRDEIIRQSGQNRFLLSIELDLDGEDGLKKVKDVAAKYPDTYPVLVLRKHGSWLRSKYKYYLRKHGFRDFHSYFDMKNDEGVLKMKHLLFYPKIELLEQYFKHPPLVLFQEELKNDPFGAIDQVSDFVSAEYAKEDIKISTVKQSYSEKQLKLVRKFNKIYKYDHSHIKSPVWKFIYKKAGGLFLHSVAYLALILPGFMLNKDPLISKKTIQKVNDLYAEDWNKCVEYAKNNRKKVFL